jgi:hypothetical protein
MFGAGFGPKLIDLGNPVERAHPMNRGLVGWWLPLPNTVGGTRLWEIMHPGTDTGTLTSGAGWAPGTNGFQAVAFDGTDDYVSVSDNTDFDLAGVTTGTGYAFACWFRRLTHDTNDAPACKRGGTALADVGWDMMMTDGGDILTVTVSDGTNSRGANSLTAFNDSSRWYHVLWTHTTAGRGRLYVNGKREFDDNWPDIDDCSNAQPLLFGIGPASSSPFNGRMTDVRIWQRGFDTDEDAWAYYDQSRRGNPDLLRRYSPAVWSFGKSAAAGPVDDPADVSGLKLWLKDTGRYQTTDTSSPVTADAQAVGRWEDQSGTGTHVTQGTAGNRPTHRTAGTAGLSAQPTVLVDRTNDVLGGGAALAWSGRPGYTLFAAVRQTTQSGATDYAVIAKDATGNRGWRLGVSNSTGRPFLIVSINASTRAVRDGDKVDCRAYPCLLVGRYNGATGELSVRVNGAPDSGTLTGSVPATIGNSGADLAVGADGFSGFFGGHIAEIAVYDVAISDADRDALEDYFESRYTLFGFEEDTGSRSPNTASHQGYTTDGTNHYTTDTGAIYKWDAGWSQTASNAAPMSGVAGVDHLGDLAYFAGKLYVPMESYTNITTFSNMKLAVYSASDLSRIATHDISAQGHEASAVAVDGANGVLWVSSYADGTTLWKYSLASPGTYLGSLALSETVSRINGLAWRDGRLYAATGEPGTGATMGAVWRIDQTTGAAQIVYHDSRRGAGVAHEGIDFSQDTMRWLVDENNGGAGSKYVNYFTPTMGDFGAAPPLESAGNRRRRLLLCGSR